MKLYEVPKNTEIVLKDDEGNSLELLFHRLEGTHSYCTDKDGNVISLDSWTEVEIKETVNDVKDAERYRALRHVLSGYGGGLVVNNTKSRGDAKAVRLYWQISDTTSFESSQDGTLDELIDSLIKKLHKSE